MPTKANLIKEAALKLIAALETGVDHSQELSTLKTLTAPVIPKAAIRRSKLEEKNWINWDGNGGSPVPERTRVTVIRRDGDIKCGCAHYFRWRWEGFDPKANDIVKYVIERKIR